jgi:predicted NBD/HSP70 family sugar kinase
MSGSLGVHALVRRAHEERVLAILRERGGLSRAQIAARSGLSRTTLSEITGDLLSRGAIVVVNTDAPRRAGSGRPAELLALDPRSGQFLGVDLGHTRARVAVADAAHEIIASEVVVYPAQTGWPDRLAAGVELVDLVTREKGITLDALQGIGVGVAGPYPADVARADVRAAFATRFAAPIVVDNNTRFAALAEASLSEARDVLYIRLADGIGGGLVVGGRLVAGAGGLAGEFGHVKIDPAGGLCRCGKRGCLETVAAVGPALKAAGVRDLAELAARRDEPRVRDAMNHVAEAVGRVLAAAALILDPEQIVIAGPLAAAAPAIVSRAAAVVAAELVGTSTGADVEPPPHATERSFYRPGTSPLGPSPLGPSSLGSSAPGISPPPATERSFFPPGSSGPSTSAPGVSPLGVSPPPATERSFFPPGTSASSTSAPSSSAPSSSAPSTSAPGVSPLGATERSFFPLDPSARGNSAPSATERSFSQAGAASTVGTAARGDGEGPPRRGPLIRAARLGDDDGARGAIAASFRQSPLLAGYPSGSAS